MGDVCVLGAGGMGFDREIGGLFLIRMRSPEEGDGNFLGFDGIASAGLLRIGWLLRVDAARVV